MHPMVKAAKLDVLEDEVVVGGVGVADPHQQQNMGVGQTTQPGQLRLCVPALPHRHLGGPPQLADHPALAQREHRAVPHHLGSAVQDGPLY